MSPDWYVSPDQVPTWLYQAVHLTGPVRAMSDNELGAQIETLSAKFEDRLAPKKPWTSSKMTAGRLEAMKKAIVGLVMTVEEVEGSFKLNQHKSDADYVAIAGSLASQADAGAQHIAQLMGEARPQAWLLANETTSPKGTCHDPHRHPSAQDRRAPRRNPPCSSTAEAGTTGLGIPRAARLQNDVAVKSIAGGQAQGSRRQARADGRGGSRHPLPARRCREGNRRADRQHGRCGAEGARCVDGAPGRARLDLRLSGARAGPGREDPRPRERSPIPAAIRPARLRCIRPLVDAGLMPAGLSRHHQRGERLFRRRQVDDRRFRGRHGAGLRALRPRLRAQASAGDAALFEADAAADLRAVGRQFPPGHAGVGAAASRHAAGQAERRRPAAALAKRYAGSKYVR